MSRLQDAAEGNMPPARKFTDGRGGEWTVAINVFMVRKLIDELEFDVRKTVEKDFAGIRRLYEDDLFLVQFLYCVAEKQLIAAGVAPEEFAERMSGDALASGCSAAARAITDFFRDARVRDTARAVIEKLEAVMNRTLTLAAARGSAELDALDVERLAQQSIASFGKRPGSSA